MAGLQPHRDTDAIYGHGLAGIAGVIASNHLGPITCLNPHGLEEFRTKSFLKRLSYWPTRFLERTYAPRCAVVVATDRALVGAVQEFLGVDITRIAVIPNAVDLGAIDVRIAACAPKGKPRDGRVRIVSTGRLEPNKGQDLLIQAVARLPNTELILVGDGSQRHRLASLISRLGVDERVSLVGKVTDLEVTEIYTSSDIYCQPSLYEGSSIAVLEAMAHRLPVVATRTGGLPDKVIPGITGLLVAPGSLEQLIEALKVLSQDAYLRAKMGRNGRELVHSQFSWEVTGPKLVGLLMSLGSVC
jgi:glycosyltransferase involved in cell wall biosynthesis